MNLFDGLMKGRFGAAARAGAGFVTVSMAGAVGLVVTAVVLWAASLTPFGLWAGLPVIAAGAVVALFLWRQGQAQPDTPAQHSVSAAPSFLSVGSQQTPRWLDNAGVGAATRARVKLVGRPAGPPPHSFQLALREPATVDADGLKQAFDRAFAAERFDEADRVLAELEKLPGQVEWTRRKHRLVRQQRERF